MQSVFDPSVLETFIRRINKLSPEAKPQWRKMTAAQMLTHIQQPVKAGLGELNLKKTIARILSDKWAMNKFRQGKGFGKNSTTDIHFIFRDDRNFEVEKQNAISIIIRFSKGGREMITKDPHSFFGKMPSQDLDLLPATHPDHHLTQFNA